MHNKSPAAPRVFTNEHLLESNSGPFRQLTVDAAYAGELALSFSDAPLDVGRIAIHLHQGTPLEKPYAPRPDIGLLLQHPRYSDVMRTDLIFYPEHAINQPGVDLSSELVKSMSTLVDLSSMGREELEEERQYAIKQLQRREAVIPAIGGVAGGILSIGVGYAGYRYDIAPDGIAYALAAIGVVSSGAIARLKHAERKLNALFAMTHKQQWPQQVRARERAAAYRAQREKDGRELVTYELA